MSIHPSIEAVAAALEADPELRARVLAASSSSDRASILADAGFELPSAEDAAAAQASLSAIAAAGTSLTPNGQKKNNGDGGGGYEPDPDPDSVGEAAAAAVGLA